MVIAFLISIALLILTIYYNLKNFDTNFEIKLNDTYYGKIKQNRQDHIYDAIECNPVEEELELRKSNNLMDNPQKFQTLIIKIIDKINADDTDITKSSDLLLNIIVNKPIYINRVYPAKRNDMYKEYNGRFWSRYDEMTKKRNYLDFSIEVTTKTEQGMELRWTKPL